MQYNRKQYNKKISKNNKGFTLLEVIITVVILAIVTAPFLSSFVTASNTNVKSKRIQEANELSQYIIERCKASDVQGAVNTFGLTKDLTLDPSGETYKGYFDSSDAIWPVAFSDKYKAEIEIRPSVDPEINKEGLPKIDKLNKKYCCVLTDILHKYDISASSASAKKVTINVTSNNFVNSSGVADVEYTVALKVEYKNASGAMLTSPIYEMSWKYKKSDFPTTDLSVYVLYQPFSKDVTIKDEIIIENEVEENVNFYIINEKVADASGMVPTLLSPENVKFFDKEKPSGVTMKDLYDNNDATGSNKLKYISVYTNVDTVAADAKAEYKNGIIKLNNIKTLYDIKLKISHSDSEISEFEATKLEIAK